MSALWEKVDFGKTALRVSRIGIGSSYGVGGADLERAHERGVNFFFWGMRRRNDFGRGLARIAAKDRDGIVIAAQSYTRMASLLRPSVHSVLRSLKVDHLDLLCLAWWDAHPPRRIVDAALALQREGKVRYLLVSCHHRPAFASMMRELPVDAIMVRYNAAHPGAEREVFPHLERGHGVLAFTATRWGSLMSPHLVPPGDEVPGAGDCYRFVLTNPSVHATLVGPSNGAQLDEAMTALDRGALSDEEMAWMRRVGAKVRDDTRAHRAIGMLDRLRSALFRPAGGVPALPPGPPG